MSEREQKPAAERELTGDQIIVLYERALNRTVAIHLTITVAGAALAVALFWLLEPLWLRCTAAALAILGSGMAQRLVVLRVRCPACGARVLARIHSILQARNVSECPACDAKLRG